LAFTKDGISFIGTDGRDSLVLTTGVGSWAFPTGGPAFIEALGGDDQVTFNGNATGVSLVGGDGSDVTLITTGGVTGQLSESSINGNAGDDTTTWLNITNSSIYGGQGADFLATNPAGGGVTTNASEINGNKGGDIISLTGSVTFTNVYGGRDDDVIFFNPTLNAFNNEIQGNRGDDTLNIAINTGGSSDNDVYGGADDDTINALFTTTNVLLSGDKGNDVIRGGQGTGNQVLSGGDDRDILIYQGNSSTTMIGGEGPDVFRFNAFSVGDAPFVEDFDTITDNIELNIRPNNTLPDGFFGATTQFGSLGFSVAGNALAARWLQAGVVNPITLSFTAVGTLLSGQLTDGNLFNAANVNQLQSRISAAALNFAPFINVTPVNALGFTQDSRRLFAFTNIRKTTVVTVTGGGAMNTFTNLFFTANTIAQFATNNVNGSDIFLV